jgi:hypothetical protein
MYDSTAVCCMQRVRYFPRYAHRVVDGKLRLPRETRTQRLTVDVRHDAPRKRVIRRLQHPRVEDRHNVAVLQPRRDADLAQEAIYPDRSCDVGLQYLDGNGAIVLAIPRQPHRRHAAMTQLPLENIAVGEYGPRGILHSHAQLLARSHQNNARRILGRQRSERAQALRHEPPGLDSGGNRFLSPTKS